MYAGSAEFYLKGRLPYPERLADVFRDHMYLDGTGRLLDLGCDPGSLSLLLASSFYAVLAVDADTEMIQVGQAAAAVLSDQVDVSIVVRAGWVSVTA